ncbi:MAG: hypothetical protein AABY79_00550 [Nitrospirota bacterium]|jgi:hypothetical protein
MAALLIIIFIILIAILFLSCSASGNEAASEDDETPYVEIFRTDTGKGHDDTYMMNLILYLGSKGIRATYDTFAFGMETAAIKTYALKVEGGKEDEAREYLSCGAIKEDKGGAGKIRRSF